MFYELDTKPSKIIYIYIYIYIYIKREGGGGGGHEKPVYKAP